LELTVLRAVTLRRGIFWFVLEQPLVFNRDDGLVGEGLEESLSVGP